MARPTRASRGSVVRWPELGPWGHTTSGFGLWATLPFSHRMVFLMELAWRSAGSSHVLLSVKCLRQCLIPCDTSLAVVVTASIIKSWTQPCAVLGRGHQRDERPLGAKQGRACYLEEEGFRDWDGEGSSCDAHG